MKIRATKTMIEKAKRLLVENGLGSEGQKVFIVDRKYRVIVREENKKKKISCECKKFQEKKMCEHILAVAIKEGYEIENSSEKAKEQSIQKYEKLGYDRYEVLSAFHKALRRGDKEKAMFFGEVMATCGETGFAVYYISSIILEELCYHEREKIQYLKEILSMGGTKYTLYAGIDLFCDIKKWWECDKCTKIRDIREKNQRNIIEGKNLIEIPEYALDKHTRRGIEKEKNGEYVERRWEGSWLGIQFRKRAYNKIKEKIKDGMSSKEISELMDEVDINEVFDGEEEIKYWKDRRW